MMSFTDTEKLTQEILSELDTNSMRSTVERFNLMNRYTGHPDGEAAVDYIVKRLEEYKVPYERLSYDAYVSLPIDACVDVITPEKKSIYAIAHVYSGEARNLCAPLFYDKLSEQKSLSQKEQKARFAAFKGKIVLTRSSGGSFAKMAAEAGAAGVIHFWPSGEKWVHHGTAGNVWGTPVPRDLDQFCFLPFVDMTKGDGEYLLNLLRNGPVKVALNIKMDMGVRRTSMPVATIPGASKKYVLISGHYDSWYEGITDNAASDAIMLDFARVFMKHRKELKRTVKIAWWSGHSDGRYAGSTWYFDNNWTDLNENCVAHINIDLAGCKNADQIRARTTLMEGREFTDSVIREFTGYEPKPYIPMVRGADQSFWGVHVPITIMPKYEPLPENCDFCCPSGGAWWHTEADTIDKLDEKIMIRDAKLNAAMACRILNAKHVPVNIPGFICEMEKFLNGIEAELSEDFVISPVFSALEELKKTASDFCRKYITLPDSDSILKKTAGELVRVTYTMCSPYYEDPASAELPFQGLRNACGVTRTNTDDDMFLFIQTDFIRQRNRLVNSFKNVAEIMKSFCDQR